MHTTKRQLKLAKTVETWGKMFATQMASSVQGRTLARPFVASRRPTLVARAKFSPTTLVETLAKDQMKKTVPTLQIGDTIKLGLAVSEGKEKTRTQKLEGVIITEHGSGTDKTYTMRRIFQGVGIEMNFLLHSPVVQSIEVVRSGRVRRAKLYYLRERTGKSAKLKEIVKQKQTPAAAKP